MSHLFDPIILLALGALVEGAGITLAVAVGLWSRNPARRETALRLIRAIRRAEDSGERE
ncbi:hypothetical protein [Actinoplanes regularis]|uniref:Uncharacterized protein n=1 Tax=Actinoplanes regularis TaxID=52697 RepID=A0A239A5Z8_9ACTN|nr:hypothetical protein [Actinoplanes regularis]GIE87070.1 hypothetical protein Are01nite_35500 [Actinoplanes regularis]SNR91055.1 hypothetical protein SAMN06264365_10792 [Actinoplanes regularis]